MDDFSAEKKMNKITCPECSHSLTVKLTASPKTGTKKFNFRDTKSFTRSTKLSALVDQLKEIEKTQDKSIVFSQFTSFLDLVEVALKQENIQFVRLDGSMSHTTRSASIETFKVTICA